MVAYKPQATPKREKETEGNKSWKWQKRCQNPEIVPISGSPLNMKLVWETACHAPLSICWLKPVFFQGRQGPCLKKVLTRRPLNLQPWDHLRQQGLTTSEESLEETCFIKICFCFAQVFLTNHPKQETEKPAPKCFCGKISITWKSSEIFWTRTKSESLRPIVVRMVREKKQDWT